MTHLRKVTAAALFGLNLGLQGCASSNPCTISNMDREVFAKAFVLGCAAATKKTPDT